MADQPGNRILVVHRSNGRRASIVEDLIHGGFECDQCSRASDAYVRLRRERFDVIISDVGSSGVDGLMLTEMVQALPNHPETVLVSTNVSAEQIRCAFKSGAFDVLSEPLVDGELPRAVHSALDRKRDRESHRRPSIDTARWTEKAWQHSNHHRPSSRSNTATQSLNRNGCPESVLVLVAAVEAKEPLMGRHAATVSRYCGELGRRMGLHPSQITTLTTAALLHDIGKIGVPDAILRKPGPLTRREHTLMRRHPQIALDILQPNRQLGDVLPLILHHHERFDGGGYPFGLAGTNIPLGARVINLCDSLDTILTQRTYKPERGLEEARAEIQRCAGAQFDPAAAEAALEWIDTQPETLLHSQVP